MKINIHIFYSLDLSKIFWLTLNLIFLDVTFPKMYANFQNICIFFMSVNDPQTHLPVQCVQRLHGQKRPGGAV